MREPGEHDAPARAHQLEGVGDGLGRAGGLDHLIHALAPREPAGRRVERAVADGPGVFGAELAREIEPPAGPAHDEHADAAGPQHLQGQEPERAGADDGGGLAGLRLRTVHGADHHGERLGDQQILVGRVRGRRPAAARRHADQLGEAAVHVDADGGAREAQVLVALAAERALAARIVGLDHDPVARAEPRHIATDCFNAPDQLVAHDTRVADRPRARPDAVVRAAKPRGRHTHQDVVGPRLGSAPGLDSEIARPVEDGSFHVPHTVLDQ